MTNKILPNILKDISFFPLQFFYLWEFIFFENFSMSKNIIIFVKPAHQLWYPTVSWKYYQVKEANYSHCCNWEDGVHACATSNPGMRNWNTGIASPIGKVHTWLDPLNSDCCMHTPRLVGVSCQNLKINLSPSLRGDYFSKDTQCKVWDYVCQKIISRGILNNYPTDFYHIIINYLINTSYINHNLLFQIITYF